MPLNCLIFQNDIARLNTTLDQARTGPNIIGETLVKKTVEKIKYLLLGSKAFKGKRRTEAAANPNMMGEDIKKESEEGKYLGDQMDPMPVYCHDASILS